MADAHDTPDDDDATTAEAPAAAADDTTPTRTSRRHDNPTPTGPRPGVRLMSPREAARAMGRRGRTPVPPLPSRGRTGRLLPPPTPRPRGASDPENAAKNARRATDRAEARAARVAARRRTDEAGTRDDGGRPTRREPDLVIYDEVARELGHGE